jgi:hypothetical protein
MIQSAGADHLLRNQRRWGNRDRTIPQAPKHNSRRHQDQQTQNQHHAKHNSTSFLLRLAQLKDSMPIVISQFKNDQPGRVCS